MCKCSVYVNSDWSELVSKDTEVSKYRQVLDAVRNEIVSGKYAVDRRLPTRSEIGERFGVGMATVQKALEALTRDGFLTARPGAGTYLVENAPHESCFGLLLPHESYSASVIHDNAVRQAAKEVDNGASIQFKYYGISALVQYRQDVNRLCDDVVCHRLAGLISPFHHGELDNTPVMTTPGVPRVLCGDMKREGQFCVGPEGGSFQKRALEYVLSRVRRRIAHLQMETETSTGTLALESELREMGLDARPYWIQRVNAGHTASPATNTIRLLMELEGDKRPDALIVHDDNLLDAVVAGLLSCDVRVPDELEVVSLANFPTPRPQGIQVRRLGFDWVELISRSIDVIRRAHQGHKSPPMFLPAVFEDELPNRRATGQNGFAAAMR